MRDTSSPVGLGTGGFGAGNCPRSSGNNTLCFVSMETSSLAKTTEDGIPLLLSTCTSATIALIPVGPFNACVAALALEADGLLGASVTGCDCGIVAGAPAAIVGSQTPLQINVPKPNVNNIFVLFTGCAPYSLQPNTTTLRRLKKTQAASRWCLSGTGFLEGDIAWTPTQF